MLVRTFGKSLLISPLDASANESVKIQGFSYPISPSILTRGSIITSDSFLAFFVRFQKCTTSSDWMVIMSFRWNWKEEASISINPVGIIGVANCDSKIIGLAQNKILRWGWFLEELGRGLGTGSCWIQWKMKQGFQQPEFNVLGLPWTVLELLEVVTVSNFNSDQNITMQIIFITNLVTIIFPVMNCSCPTNPDPKTWACSAPFPIFPAFWRDFCLRGTSS